MFRDAYSTRQTTLEESIHEAVVHRMAEAEQLLAEADRRLEEARRLKEANLYWPEKEDRHVAK